MGPGRALMTLAKRIYHTSMRSGNVEACFFGTVVEPRCGKQVGEKRRGKGQVKVSVSAPHLELNPSVRKWRIGRGFTKNGDSRD